MPSRTPVPGSGGSGDTTLTPWHKSDIDKLAGGRVAYTNITADVTITTANDISTITWTAFANRFYDIEAAIACRSTVAGDQIRVMITDASNVPLVSEELTTVSANNFITFRPVVRNYNPGATVVIYKLRAVRTNGSGVCTAEPTFFGTTNIAHFVGTDVSPNF
jgi:hypothetical protein